MEGKVLMRSVAVLLLCCAPRVLVAQAGSAPMLVDERTAAQHQLMHTDPVYPPIARAAHVHGEVKIQLGIDASGHVVSTTLLSGPPMLVGAAMDAVRRWTYTPFEQDGHAVTVTTAVTLRFDLAQNGGIGQIPSAAGQEKGDKVAEKYFPADRECREKLGRKDFAKAAIACRRAAEIAETFPEDVRFVERRSAFVTAATADLQDNEYPEALEYATKAVAVVELGHDDESGACAAYTTRAEAEAATNDLAGADRDLSKAEDAERGAVRTIQSEQLKIAYKGTLKAVLSLHARLLTAMGKSTEAQARLDEAAKL